MATDFDPYRILQVPPEATDEQIRHAYDQMSQAAWADGSNPEAAQEVDVAYRILRDPEQRRAYDERRAAALATAPALEFGDQGQLPDELGKPKSRAPWRIGDMAMAVAAVVGGTLAVSVPAALLADSYLESGQDIEDDPTALTIVLAASLALELLLFATAVWFGPRKYKLPLASLGLRKPERGGWLFPFGLWISALAIVYTYFGILSLLGIEPDSDVPEEAFESAGPLIVLAILSMGLAPFMEEVFFRGFIFGGLHGRWGWVLAAIVSGGLFGLAHIGNPGSLLVVAPIAGVGMLFAWGYKWSGSLIGPIIAHFLFNSIAIMVGIAATSS
jgi:CAAX protease family protein